MSEITKQKEKLQQELKRITSRQEDIIQELELLEQLTDVDDETLYSNINDYVIVTKKPNEDFEYILGGDGRSLPWSEIRKGLVIDLKTKIGVYLSFKQKQKVESLIKLIHSADAVNFIN